MAELLHKTLGGVSPRGKARVYFTCHPEDHNGYFQEITDELLKHSDCAVYYYEEEPEQDDEYYVNLERMQLLVMPVTTRLLYLPNRAMDVEFAYAMEHHIPVLPLMQEQGLEDQYAEKFGNLQFLDKGNRDITAIPYEEKLKKYLTAVLLNDELTAQVRAAFDAWIFLSYRKKDRKAAQALMRLIHRDPRCRDIAVWYDEFLNPGEDFNDAIRTALEESQLFVLAVTPNLLETGNYVMREEYPEARKAGKPILPAEMEATDHDALGRDFPGMPEPLDPGTDGKVSGAVLDALGALAVRENDEDPQHNFFIGLAYLSGLFVEKDHERAVRLITQAAEARLTEAMEKLVTMYETGEGVERDYLIAITWREKLVELARQQFERTRSAEDGYTYFGRLWDLGDAWDAQWNLSEAKAAYEKMLTVSEKLYGEDGRIEGRWLLSACYDKLGDISVAEKELTSAKKWYSKSLEIRQEMAQGNEPEVQISIAINYFDQGIVAQEECSFAEAKNWYKSALESIGKLEGNGGLEAVYIALGCCQRLGRVAESEGNMNEARAWYKKALELSEGLAKGGTTEALKNLIVSYSGLGNFAETEGNFSEARKWYQKALEISESLAQNNTLESLRELSICYNNLGRLAEAENCLDNAKQWYQKGLEAVTRLSYSGAPEALRHLSVSYNALGKLAEVEGDFDGAKIWYEKALEISVKLSKSETPEALRDLAISYERMGNVAFAVGDESSASAWCKKALEIRDRVAEITHTPLSYDDLAVSYYKVGVLNWDINYLTDALSIWRILAESCPDILRYQENIKAVETIIEQIQADDNG